MAEHHIVVVGAGPSGVAALRALVRRPGIQRITMVDPLPAGLGEAFGTVAASDPILICNTGIGVTSVDPDEMDDFYDYLVERGWPVAPEDSVPRHVVGEYARQRYLDAVRSARAQGRSVEHVRALVQNIDGESGAYRVHLNSGLTLDATHIVMATGIHEPTVPPEFAPFIGAPSLLQGAFPAKRLRDLPPGSRVLVVGLRNSGIDAAVILNDAGHHATLTSPSGRLSAVRDRLRRPADRPIDVAALTALDPASDEHFDAGWNVFARALEGVSAGLAPADQTSHADDVFDQLRNDADYAESGKARWTDLIYDGINALNSTLAPWTNEQRSAVLGRSFGFFYRYAASLPLLSARRLLTNVDAGLLDISPTYLARAELDDSGWTIHWKDGSQSTFDAVVLTTGYHAPRMRADDAGVIHVERHGTTEGIVGMTADLRAIRQDTDTPEKIWLVGSGSNLRVVFAGVLWVAAQQAGLVADSISADVTGKVLT